MFGDTHEGEFDQREIAALPHAPGAYRLLNAGRVLFVGMASGARSLRTELNRHWRGDFGPLTQGASHFECLVAHTSAHAHELYRTLYEGCGPRPEPGLRRN
jgi:excinuclease UvrABC nuclease subunit